MFRLPSRQIFKTLRSPLRYPLRLSSRDVHTIQVPDTAPATYDTLARRFSSSLSPLGFFINKRQQEARDRGEFIDIYDVGGVRPKDHDVLITDIDSKKLRSEIGEVIGIPYPLIYLVMASLLTQSVLLYGKRNLAQILARLLSRSVPGHC
jgi:hypothetical protein